MKAKKLFGRMVSLILALCMTASFCLGSVLAVSSTVTAVPTISMVLLDGESTAFDAYNIGGANYFKLRDMAYALSGTEKQFDVAWDGSANAITLIPGMRYTSVGGEMLPGSGLVQTPTRTNSKVLLDGRPVSLEAYNIGGNNYFKLRDIGEVIGFHVDWDEASRTIIIDTSSAGNNSTIPESPKDNPLGENDYTRPKPPTGSSFVEDDSTKPESPGDSSLSGELTISGVSTSKSVSVAGATYQVSFSISVSVTGGTGKYSYKFETIQNGEVTESTGWTRDNGITGNLSGKGTCEICISVKDSSGEVVTQSVDMLKSDSWR